MRIQSIPRLALTLIMTYACSASNAIPTNSHNTNVWVHRVSGVVRVQTPEQAHRDQWHLIPGNMRQCINDQDCILTTRLVCSCVMQSPEQHFSVHRNFRQQVYQLLNPEPEPCPDCVEILNRNMRSRCARNQCEAYAIPTVNSVP